jgi:DNA/RNA endonuclease YhcR with UshA esterase domain
MKISATVAVALCLTAAAMLCRADDTNSPTLTIGAAQTADHIGKQVTVTGVVAQVSIRPSVTFLNFDKAFPSNVFSAIVWNRNTNEFESLPSLKGKTVAVTGKLIEYKDKPEMELSSKTQLKVLSGKK